MTKTILEEYCQTKEEIKLLEEKLERKKEQLGKIEIDGSVIDMVSGGYGGNQHFKIEGLPMGTIALVQDQIDKQEFILRCRYNKLIEQETEVERFISNLPTSELRRIADYRYIQGLDWKQSAKKMGKGYTETSVRLTFSRYINRVFGKKEPDEINKLIELDRA